MTGAERLDGLRERPVERGLAGAEEAEPRLRARDGRGPDGTGTARAAGPGACKTSGGPRRARRARTRPTPGRRGGGRAGWRPGKSSACGGGRGQR